MGVTVCRVARGCAANKASLNVGNTWPYMHSRAAQHLLRLLDVEVCDESVECVIWRGYARKAGILAQGAHLRCAIVKREEFVFPGTLAVQASVVKICLGWVAVLVMLQKYDIYFRTTACPPQLRKEFACLCSE